MNFISNVFVPLISAFIGGSFSIFIYRKGIEDKKHTDKLIEIENNYKKKKFFISSIKSISFFITKQIEGINKLNENISSGNNSNLQLSIVSELKLSDLKEISIKDLFEIFVLNSNGDFSKKSVHFTNLKNSLLNIKKTIKKEEANNIIYREELNKIGANWNINVSQLNQEYDLLIKSNNLSISDRELINQLKPTIIESQPGIKNDIISAYKELIQPIRIILFENKLEEDHSLSFFNFIKLTTDCNQLYQMHLGIQNDRKKNLILTSNNLNQLNNMIDTSLEELKSK